MSKMGKIILVLALFSCAVAIVFMIWDFPTANKRQQSEPQHYIEVILKAKANPPDFWRIVEQGIDLASQELNVQCTVTGPEFEVNVDEQIELVEAALARKPDAIVLAAGDVNLLAPVCERIAAAKIPLVIVDSDVNFDGKVCFVGTNNYELGQKLAELVDSLIGKTEHFGVIGHVAGTSTAIGRSQGFLESVYDVENRLSGFEYCNGFPEIAHEQTVKMLTENPEIKCMVGLNESSSLGISTALNELGLTGKVMLVACDSSQEQIQYMENGTIMAVVVQNPFNMGYLSITAAIDAIEGRKVSSEINTGCIVITRDDMNKLENQKLLFPFVE